MKELFTALDVDNSGGVTENEFISGCKTDLIFVQLLTDHSGDFILGYSDQHET